MSQVPRNNQQNKGCLSANSSAESLRETTTQDQRLQFVETNLVAQDSLLRINMLVDSTAEHELLSFLDAFSRYSQIQMYPANQEKTAFITDRGLYYHLVMPFGLKNTRATYHR